MPVDPFANTGLRLNADGSIRPFTAEEIAAIGIETADVRDGSHPTWNRGTNATSVRRAFWYNGDMIEDFAAYMLGGAVTYTSSAIGRVAISRLMPQTFPRKPKVAALAIEDARGARSAGKDNADGVPTYKKGHAVVRYEHVPFRLLQDSLGAFEEFRYVQRLPSTTEVSYLTLPGSMLQFTNQAGVGRPKGIPVPYNIGRAESQSLLKYRWTRVPFGGWGGGSALYARVYGDIENGVPPYVGTINNQSLFEHVDGSLLYLGVEEELLTDPLGNDLCWDLTHVWLKKPQNHTWLYFNDPGQVPFLPAPGYYQATTDGVFYATPFLPDQKALFNARDHSKLFWVG